MKLCSVPSDNAVRLSRDEPMSAQEWYWLERVRIPDLIEKALFSRNGKESRAWLNTAARLREELDGGGSPIHYDATDNMLRRNHRALLGSEESTVRGSVFRRQEEAGR